MPGYSEEKKHGRMCLDLDTTHKGAGCMLMKRRFDGDTGADLGLRAVEPLLREQIEQRLKEAQRGVADLEEMLKDFDELQATRKE
jgi:hypothetical protein